ncbi:hypothetical protein ACVIW2_005331 [Bradyrhizobium huanghuaihaiense]|uniref:Uncharacterized protein n=1 Tax=Bradyrhizobium huanghuaihaiense TaxID=990078 RepID=A0A562S3P1_9BRAD|nr:hypothetical protein [Bradyrhizobium huanghuaihaiense]TWI75981.1 hypothetical protein IQ16_00212 [Bradyrhizobium huanghuaihaiense]
MSFKRGIWNGDFLRALEALAQQDGWWKDVLADPSLIIGVRDDYLNIYWQGQSIFKVSFKGGKVAASTHEKYLLNPDLKDQISLVEGKFAFGEAEPRMLTRDYEGAATLAKLKRAASLYSGQEKEGVHEIATSNPSVVDVEIAINASGIPDIKRNLPRMDLANFEMTANGVDLVFWEAKTFSNRELENGKIVDQIKDYRTVIDLHQTEIDKSYRCVAENLADMARWSNDRRSVAAAIRAVKGGAKLNVNSANVGLLVYDYTADQSDRKDKSGKTLKERVTESLAEVGVGQERIKFKGTPRGLTI